MRRRSLMSRGLRNLHRLSVKIWRSVTADRFNGSRVGRTLNSGLYIWAFSFSDKELADIKSSGVVTDRADPRFGYYIHCQNYQGNEGNLRLGFEIWNKVLCRLYFKANLRRNTDRVAELLFSWASSSERFRLYFETDDGKSFEANRVLSLNLSLLKDRLGHYGDLDRGSSGVHKGKPGGWSGSHFVAVKPIPGLAAR